MDDLKPGTTFPAGAFILGFACGVLWTAFLIWLIWWA